jgi:hypothetical protein
MWEQSTDLTGGGSEEGPAEVTKFDPLGALDRLAKLSPAHGTSEGVDWRGCGRRFRRQAEKLREQLRTQLVDHFLGPPIETRDSTITTNSSNSSHSLD